MSVIAIAWKYRANIERLWRRTTSYETRGKVIPGTGKSRSIGKMRLIRGYFMTRDGTKLKEEKKERLSWTTRGHSSVKSTSCGCHENGTGVERAGRAESRRRGETSGASRKCIHSSLFAPAIFLHPLFPLCLPADTSAPIGNGAFGQEAALYRWRVECYSIMTARCQSRARVGSPSLFLFPASPSRRNWFTSLLRLGFYVSARPTFSSLALTFFYA